MPGSLYVFKYILTQFIKPNSSNSSSIPVVSMFPGNEKRDAKKVWDSESKEAKCTYEAQRKRIQVLRDLKQDAVEKVGKEKEVKI